ncbi:hypothetical protein HPB47_023740 [Ixodes persulcatus]|uniref:Uncharacterized protein n=1 Tax=Ixodes persulcatus TaxID=34615 RepID=A0AC60Q673_IXOPE|nr:hypothetical protein HPB47_023740 [Ixodes persulcatus]
MSRRRKLTTGGQGQGTPREDDPTTTDMLSSAEVRDEHSDHDDRQHYDLTTEARDTATSSDHGLAPDGATSGVLDFQMLMQAAIRTAVREALEGAAQLFQTTQSPQRHPPTGASSAMDGRLATTSAQLVPVYDPSSDTQLTVEAWLNKVDNLAAAYEWSDRQTTCFALTKLHGVAKTWYDGVTFVQRTYDERKVEMKKAFPSASSFQHVFRDMEKRKKGRHETIEAYFYDKLAKSRRCNLDNRTCIEYLITGLEDEDLVRSLSVRDYATPDELLRSAEGSDDGLSTEAESDTDIVEFQRQEDPAGATGMEDGRVVNDKSRRPVCARTANACRNRSTRCSIIGV